MRPKRYQALLLCASTGLLLLGVAFLSSVHSPVALADPGNLFVTQGGSGTTCSQAVPCTLQTAIGKAVNGDTIYVAQGSYKGTGDAVITITKSISLYGGWNGSGSGVVVRDPAAFATILDGEQARRVVYISGNITPTLDGFTITRGNASGLIASCPSAVGCGGGIFIGYAHAVVAHNVITDNIASTTASSFSAAGGGLYVLGAERSVIRSNVIISNAGSTAGNAMGGGIHLRGNGDGIQIQSNQIISNSATTGDFSGWGGGIYGGPDGALIQGNIIEGNQANSTNGGSGSALFQFGGNAQYIGNLVHGNKGGNTITLQYSRSYFGGNQVLDNATASGVVLSSASGDGPTLVNNIIARSGSTTLSMFGSSPADIVSATLLHNTLVGSGTGSGVYATYANAYMTNTIVVSHTWGITNTTLASSSVMPDHTLFWANANDGIRGTNPVDGNPAFVNPAAANFHLGAGSAAMDSGVATSVTTDIDGDPRPVGLGYDIGADERGAYHSLLPLLSRY